MEGNIFIGDGALYVRERMGVRSVLDIGIRFHDGDETAEAGHALLNHFRQLHQNLNRTDENADIKGVHGQIRHIHLSLCDQEASEHQGDEIHHTLKKQVAAHEGSHAFIVCIFGKQKALIAFSEFRAFYILVGKGLYHTDAGKRILQTGVYISDFFPVVHEGDLHSLVLAEGKKKHDHHQHSHGNGEPPVDEKQKNKGANNLNQ